MSAAARVSILLVVVSGCGHGAAPPPADPPDLVELGAQPTAELVTAGAAGQLAVRVRVSAAGIPGAARAPLDLVLALDTSGSMDGAPIAATRAAAHDLVARLGPDDRLGIVTFDSHARVVLPTHTMTPIARAWADLEIDQLVARGTTDLTDGMAAALDLADQGRTPGSIDRVVVMSDGVPNDATAVPSLVARARQTRTAITTLGVGVEFDENLLGDIALETGGAYHFVSDASAVAQIFDDEILQMKQAIARGVVVTIQPGPGVTLEEVPGVDDSGAARVAYLGDLAGGDLRDVIVPLTTAPRRDRATVELVDVTVAYDDAAFGRGMQQRDAFVAVHASSDAAAVAASVKLPLEIARRRATAASAILDAIRRARTGDVAGGLAALKQAEKDTRAAAEQLHDSELASFADRMARLEQSLAQVAVASIDTVQPVGGEIDAPAPSPSNDEDGKDRWATQRANGAGAAPPRVYKVAADQAVETELRLAHEQANHDLRR